MVQKNQYTYNVPPGSSDYIYTRGCRPSFTLFYLTFHNEFNYIAISPMEFPKDLPNDFPKIPNEFYRGFA